MTVNQADISGLITYLNTDATLTSLISSRLYRGEPMKIPSGIYVTVSPRLENQKGANNNPRLRFRCIGNDETVKFSELQAIMGAIVNALSGTATSGWYGFGQGSTYFEDYIDGNRPMIEFSMFGYYDL